MQILYNAKTDLLYLRLDDRKQQVINKRLSEDIVLDLGEDNRIVGIEILNASKHLNLERLSPVIYTEEMGEFRKNLNVIQLEGIWKDIKITDEDIQETREELLRKLKEKR